MLPFDSLVFLSEFYVYMLNNCSSAAYDVKYCLISASFSPSDRHMTMVWLILLVLLQSICTFFQMRIML